jgi:glutathione S-transferase
MTVSLYAHPFSLYCQKVLIALYETGTEFTYRFLGDADPTASAELAGLWPIRRFPVLVDGERTILESSVIIEHVDLRRPGPERLVPADPEAALEARMLDRVFDNYVSSPVQAIVFDSIRPEDSRDPYGVRQARDLLETAYGWLDARMADREWAADGRFGLADCAAGPALFYADWVQPIADRFPALRAYRSRLLARPSFARAVEEARPYRHLFPLGAPDRD